MPPSDLLHTVPCQPYQSPQSQRVYQYMEEKGVYQLDSENFENRLGGFYTAVDPEDEEVDYLDKGFKKVIANFVGIEIDCSKCSSSFFSKSQLQNYLKASYVEAVQAILFLPTQPVSPIPIVESKAIILSLGSGLAFRSWHMQPHLSPLSLTSFFMIWTPPQLLVLTQAVRYHLMPRYSF